jgi:hypothetical protein
LFSHIDSPPSDFYDLRLGDKGGWSAESCTTISRTYQTKIGHA